MKLQPNLGLPLSKKQILSFALKTRLILFWALYFLACRKPQIEIDPIAKKGILDFQGFSQEKIIPISGEWIIQKGFQSNSEKHFLSVPGFWNKSKIPEFENQPFGAATYTLKLIHLEPGDYALKIYEIHNAYRVLINGKAVFQFGEVSEDPNLEIRRIGKPIVEFTVLPKEEIELKFEVSNWFEANAGIRNVPEFGKKSIIHQRNAFARQFDFLTFGALLFLGFSSLFFFILTREEHSTIFLSVICATLATRIFFTEEHYIFEYFPNFPPNLEFRIDLGSLFVLVGTILYYIHSIFPKELNKKWVQVFATPAFSSPILFLFFKDRNLEIYFQIFLIYILVLVVVCTSITVMATLRKRIASKTFLISILTFFGGGINDILSRFDILDTPYISHYTFLLFILFQTVIISVRYRSLLNFTKQLNRELEVKFRAISKTIQEAILVLDDKGILVSVNEGAHRIFGWDLKQT